MFGTMFGTMCDDASRPPPAANRTLCVQASDV
jgi:hypothetical protein